MQEHQSEIACLLARISAEYEAAQRGLYGLASDSARHLFINTKMERMSRLHTQLYKLVGDDAIVMVAETLEQLPDSFQHEEVQAGVIEATHT